MIGNTDGIYFDKYLTVDKTHLKTMWVFLLKYFLKYFFNIYLNHINKLDTYFCFETET